MNQELIEMARQAASPEEIMKIAEENDIYMVKEEAESIYKQLHTNSELSDEELEEAAGGGCKLSGKTIVTSGCKCFTGKYEDVGDVKDPGAWYVFSIGGTCGHCKHLQLTLGMGYCGVE